MGPDATESSAASCQIGNDPPEGDQEQNSEEDDISESLEALDWDSHSEALHPSDQDSHERTGIEGFEHVVQEWNQTLPEVWKDPEWGNPFSMGKIKGPSQETLKA